MNPDKSSPDKSARHARRAVAQRLRAFIQTLMSQFTTTSAELVQRAEDERAVSKRPEGERSVGVR
jgi:hypothetical protein